MIRAESVIADDTASPASDSKKESVCKALKDCINIKKALKKAGAQRTRSKEIKCENTINIADTITHSYNLRLGRQISFKLM